MIAPTSLQGHECWRCSSRPLGQTLLQNELARGPRLVGLANVYSGAAFRTAITQAAKTVKMVINRRVGPHPPLMATRIVFQHAGLALTICNITSPSRLLQILTLTSLSV